MSSMPESVPGGSPQYAPGITLTLTLKGQPVQTYTFEKPTVMVGRDPYCDVYVENPGVSRQHFKIECGDTGEYRVTDMGSSNGTYLNDRPVKVGTLRDGDVIQFSKYSLRFNVDELVGGEDDGPRRHSAAEGATMMLSPSEVRQMVTDARNTPAPRLSVVTRETAPPAPAPAPSSGMPAWLPWVLIGAAALTGIAILILTSR